MGNQNFNYQDNQLQVADRSLIYRYKVVEDVLFKMDKFLFPVDFVVVDIKENSNISFIYG